MSNTDSNPVRERYDALFDTLPTNRQAAEVVLMLRWFAGEKFTSAELSQETDRFAALPLGEQIHDMYVFAKNAGIEPLATAAEAFIVNSLASRISDILSNSDK